MFVEKQHFDSREKRKVYILDEPKPLVLWSPKNMARQFGDNNLLLPLPTFAAKGNSFVSSIFFNLIGDHYRPINQRVFTFFIKRASCLDTKGSKVKWGT